MEKLVVTYNLITNEFYHEIQETHYDENTIFHKDSNNRFYTEFAGIYPITLSVEDAKNHLLQGIAEYIDSVRVQLLKSENNLIKAFSEIHQLNS